MAGLDSKHLIPSNDQLESRSRSSPLKKDHVFGICSHLFQCFRLVNFMQHIVYIYKIYQDITIHLYPQGGPVQVFFLLLRSNPDICNASLWKAHGVQIYDDYFATSGLLQMFNIPQ